MTIRQRDEIAHIEDQIRTFTHRRRYLEQQQAEQGSLTPFGIVNELEQTLQAIAQAEAKLARLRAGPSGERTPYHGYYYRMLTKQGASAPGGARDYLVNGLMIGGFAVIAWPAEYESSGVMTFIVNQDGIVYEQDFGPNTEKIVSEITTYDPGEGWRKVE